MIPAVTQEQAEGMDDMADYSVACRGPCDQGRRLCPCPEACHVPRKRMGQARRWECLLLNNRPAVVSALLSALALAASVGILLMWRHQ